MILQLTQSPAAVPKLLWPSVFMASLTDCTLAISLRALATSGATGRSSIVVMSDGSFAIFWLSLNHNIAALQVGVDVVQRERK